MRDGAITLNAPHGNAAVLEGGPLQWRPVAETDEDVMIDSATAGDQWAFASLYSAYRGRVYGYLSHRAATRSDAEDLTQDVFLQAWRAIGRYRRTGSPFVAWLLAIAHNTVISYHRRRARTEQSIEPDDTEWSAEVPTGDGSDGLVDCLAVQQLLENLRPQHQRILTMRFLEDLSHRDVATTLGKTEANVRVLQHRALEELRRRLEPA